jgi:tetratricopeptide (TPR) repeat protein
MRVYVLLRPLTVEERIADMALNPNDLVGRDAEKADLHAAYHRAVYQPGVSSPPPASTREPEPKKRERDRGAGEFLARVIVGEMGIGKTALVETFLSELPEDARVVRVECSPVRIDLPFSTVSELLRETVEVTADDGYDEAVQAVVRVLRESGNEPRPASKLVAALAELASERQLELQDEDAAAQHHGLVVKGVRLLFGAIAGQSPLVVVVDGLQWADRASLEVLQEILQRSEPLPVLTLLLTRPDERVESFIEGLVRNQLRGLETDQQIRLVQARLGVREGVAQVCRELVPRVGGNPYFLLEMVDALLERGALEILEPGHDDEAVLVRREDRFESADALPTTIEQLVGDRLAELPPAEHDVVDWLAVAGGPLSEPDLLALTRLADDEAITRLCARGLCDKRGRSIDFRHPLVRDVAYQGLDPVQRARMHRRLGEHLATTPLAKGLSAAIVAQHLERGEAPRQAAELYMEAAQAALNAHQTQLAMRYFQKTLQLLPVGDHRRMIAHEALERIFRRLGQSQERRSHLESLRRLARESRQARWLGVALVRTALLHLDEGSAGRGLPLAQRAADVARYAKQPDLEVEALTILCELVRDLGDVNGALAACDRALAVAQSSRVSRRARAEVLRAKGVLLRRAGRLHGAVETHAEAIAMFHSVGARRREARARNALGFALFVLGRYEDSIAMCLSSLALDVQIGGRFQVAKTLANIGVAYARLGDTERGLAYFSRAREAHERYEDHDGRVDTSLVMASMLLEMGQIERAKELLHDASSLAVVSGSAYDKIHEAIVRALVCRAEGDSPAAARFAADARQQAESQALVSYHVYATAIEAAARVDLGDTQAGVLLATTALGAVEAMEGSEYGIEVRSLTCEAVIQAMRDERLSGATPSLTADVSRRALDHVDLIAGYVRDPFGRERFFQRPPVKRIVDHAMRYSGRDASLA